MELGDKGRAGLMPLREKEKGWVGRQSLKQQGTSKRVVEQLMRS